MKEFYMYDLDNVIINMPEKQKYYIKRKVIKEIRYKFNKLKDKSPENEFNELFDQISSEVINKHIRILAHGKKEYKRLFGNKDKFENIFLDNPLNVKQDSFMKKDKNNKDYLKPSIKTEENEIEDSLTEIFHSSILDNYNSSISFILNKLSNSGKEFSELFLEMFIYSYKDNAIQNSIIQLDDIMDIFKKLLNEKTYIIDELNTLKYNALNLMPDILKKMNKLKKYIKINEDSITLLDVYDDSELLYDPENKFGVSFMNKFMADLDKEIMDYFNNKKEKGTDV